MQKENQELREELTKHEKKTKEIRCPGDSKQS